MSRRTERVANLIRNTLGELLLAKMSDPRLDPVRTSITRVEVPEDLLTAKVFVSIVGDQKEQKRGLQALRHAAGYLQDKMMDRISLRNTPLLRFELDTKFKKTMETLNLISEVMQEIRDKEQRQDDSAEDPSDASDSASPRPEEQ
jgi:ribosome-binding factor A